MIPGRKKHLTARIPCDSLTVLVQLIQLMRERSERRVSAVAIFPLALIGGVLLITAFALLVFFMSRR